MRHTVKVFSGHQMTCWRRTDSRFHLAFGAYDLGNKSILIRCGGFKIQRKSAVKMVLLRGSCGIPLVLGFAIRVVQPRRLSTKSRSLVNLHQFREAVTIQTLEAQGCDPLWA